MELSEGGNLLLCSGVKLLPCGCVVGTLIFGQQLRLSNETCGACKHLPVAEELVHTFHNLCFVNSDIFICNTSQKAQRMLVYVHDFMFC